MLTFNPQERKTQIQLEIQQNAKSSIQITRQAKLAQAIGGEKKLEMVKVIKRMDELMKVLKGKNSRADNKHCQLENEFSGIDQHDNIQQLTYKRLQPYPYPLIANQRPYNNQFNLQNSHQNDKISSIESFNQTQLINHNHKLKTALSKCKFIHHQFEISKMQHSTNRNFREKIVNGSFQSMMKSVENKYQQLKSIYNESKERFGKLENEKNKEQMLYSMENYQSKTINDSIRDYLIKLIDNRQICDLLATHYGQIPTTLSHHQHPQQSLSVFLIFLRQLFRRILQQEDLNPNIFSTSFNTMTNKYFVKYVSNSEKHSMYVRIRQKKIYKQEGNGDGINEEMEREREFWLKCMMMFFAQENSHQQLIQLLQNNPQQPALTTALSHFYTHTPIPLPTSSSLHSHRLYLHNPAYRILTKILTKQPLIQSEYEILNAEQKDILVMIKLKFDGEFYRTMQFKQAEEMKVNALKESVENHNREKIADAVRKIISLLAFDKIFFDYFLPYRQSITNYHLLLLLQLLLSNPILLKHSIYPIKKWVFTLLQIVKSVIKNIEFNKNEKQIVMIIKLMQTAKNLLEKSDFEEQLQSVLLVRKELLREILNPKFNFIQIVQNQFQLHFSSIQRIIIKSLQTNEDEDYFINTCISSYLKNLNFYIDNIQRKEGSQIEDDTSDNLSNKVMEDDDFNWLRQFKQEINLDRFKSLNKQFLLGLKLLNRYLVRRLNLNEFQCQGQDKVSYCLTVLDKTKLLLSKFYHIFTLSSEKNQILQQESTKEGQTVWTHTQIEQSSRFLYDACSLLEIGQFLINFMTLQQHFDNRNMEGVWRQTNFIQHLQSKYDDLAVGLGTLCKNIQKFSIADKTFGQYLLYQYSEILMKSIENVDAKKSRRIKSQANELNGPMLMEFISRFSKIINENKKIL